MFCPKCGTQAPDGAQFCEQCGATLPTAAGAPAPAEGAFDGGRAAPTGPTGPKTKALIPVIAVAAVLAAVIGAGFATGWFGLAGEGDEPSKDGSVSVGASSSADTPQPGTDTATPSQEGQEGQTTAFQEPFVVSDEVVDAASKDGYKVSGTITSNIGEDCNQVNLTYQVYFMKKDNYGDQVEDSYTSNKYVYDLPAQSSKEFNLLFTSPENAQNIVRVELVSAEAGQYSYTTSDKVLTSEEYSIEGLVGEDKSYYVSYTGKIANNTDYKWERVTVYVTRVYDKDGVVIWDDHGTHDMEDGYFDEGDLLTGEAQAEYVKNGESGDIQIDLYPYKLPSLSKNQIDHFDVRVVATPDNG